MSTVLIDAIVRQTVVLIAQLSTRGGGRTPIAHLADHVFLDLVGELKAQGLGTKVIADMFGLALRTYQERVRRLTESSSFRGRSLWESVLAYVLEAERATGTEVFARFARDDEAVVRSVLRDLVESGLLVRSGRGDAARYRPADPSDGLGHGDDADVRDERLAYLVWVAINADGPVTRARLVTTLPMDAQALDAALERLVQAGRVRRRDDEYDCEECVIPLGEPAGWEGAVLDHFQAMVGALCAKLDGAEGEAVGGSTYRFDVWDGHPLRDEVLELLATSRARLSELRGRVEAHNRAADPALGAGADRVVFYLGQNVLAGGES